MDQSGEFSDEGLDEFEESVEDPKAKKKGSQVNNKPYDEAYEVSQDLSVAESYDGRDAKAERDKKLRNQHYDEAYEVSMSVDQSAYSPKAGAKGMNNNIGNGAKGGPGGGGDAKGFNTGGGINSVLSKSDSIKHSDKPFDEEVNLDGSDDSVDTVTQKAAADRKKAQQGPGGPGSAAHAQQQQQQPPQQQQQSSASGRGAPPGPDFKPQGRGPNEAKQQPPQQQQQQHQQQQQQKQPSPRREGGEDSGSEGGEEAEESYEHIEGAYHPQDWAHLNVTAEVKDLFQYIERYKPVEVELPTTLKCFIPEYIPTIGEMDAFLKIPRPDGKPDDLGLKFLDEPSSAQSDPTVLELQLRALSKKVQYGDVVVRSIEDAVRNPAAIDRWMQSISDLHRTKPPPQVFYKKPMPDIDTLMEVWPADFEAALEKMQLPSPDLDLTLVEYAKLLCSLLDIPTYDNPIEAVHLMFSLYIAFRDCGAHVPGGMGGEGKEDMYGGADVMEINQASGYK